MVATAPPEIVAELGALLDGGTLTDVGTAAEQLFGVAATLRGESALRRVLADGSIDESARTDLAQQVFGGVVGELALSVTKEAVRRRWTSAHQLTATLERLGVVGVVRSAGARSDKISDELFAVGGLVQHHPELRGALSDASRSVEDRSALLRGLVEGQVSAPTLVLVEHALASQGGSVEQVLADYQQVAAEVRDELLATVRSARELSEADRERLGAVLGRQYGRDVRLRLVVDPELVGGIRIEIGDDVIDGTVSSRLDDARRRLAG